MKELKIGIIGPETDISVKHFYKCIKEKGYTPVLVDSAKYPNQMPISLDSNGKQTFNSVDISDIKSWIVRKYYLNMPVFKLEDGDYDIIDDWRTHYIASREQYSVFTSWLYMLESQGCTLMNPVSSFNFHFLKTYQLEIFRQHKLPIPKTLISNNANEVIEFSKSIDRIIYKPAAGGGYCKELTPADLTTERLKQLKNSPVIFQELIDGENIRVNLVGNKIISASGIKTNSLDYRGKEEYYYPVKLPSEIEELCIKAAQINNMNYSGVDLIKRNNQYYLLECNPSPIYLGIERQFQAPITDSIIDYLADSELAKA